MTACTLRERLAALPPLSPAPLVSVVMAVRNEARHIARALEAVRAQDWPRERLEIIVADGMSDDGTADQLDRIAARDPRVRRIANPDRYVAAGLNRALAEARGDVIVRVDGHCRVPASYVRAGVDALREGRAECAGGPVRALGETPMARAIAIAMSTPFGVGGASFRWARETREVDHIPFGVWRRELFEVIGSFDETLVRNQDDELSDRLRRAGGRILLLSGQVVDYWSRATLGGLARQYFGYGYWKVRVIRRRGGWPSSPRHLVPAAFLLALALGSAAGLASRNVAWAAAVPALYALFLFVATTAAYANRRESSALWLPLVLPVMHVAYGAGFLAALPAPGPAPAPAAHPAERRAEAA